MAIVKKSVVNRKKGYLYYIDGKGNVCEAKMNRKGGKKGRKVCAVKPAKKAAKKAAKKTVRKPAKKAARKTAKRKK